MNENEVELAVTTDDGKNFTTTLTGKGVGIVNGIATLIIAASEVFGVPPLQVLADVTKVIMSQR